MTAISERMLGFLERLAEMFPKSTYQSRLEDYLKGKSITDTAQLEHYIRLYEEEREKV